MSAHSHPSNWAFDTKYFQQALDALERVKFDLEDGIILKLQVERQRQLEQHVIKNCY
jgi:hypothetical protein